MKINCPSQSCSLALNSSPTPRRIVRYGSYYRKSDSRWVKRFLCKNCKRHFSLATLSPKYFQKKRRLNHTLSLLFSSGVSQRRAALILGISKNTSVRKFRFLAEQEPKAHEKFLARYQNEPLTEIQFDDLETSEHTKCKPLSVTLAIDPKERKILGFQVSRMPAKGLLTHTARKKYGYRKDERGGAWDKIMKALVPYVAKNAVWTSDENPHYPKYLFKHHPTARHIQIKGGRGAITGQGELKKLRFDPLFKLNHTCAMLRANMNRLFRKTWCTTKTVKGLEDHLYIFMGYFNRTLSSGSTG